MKAETSFLDNSTQTEKMSNTLVGYVESFVPGGNFSAYADRVKQLIKVSKIAEDEQAALFITIMGTDVYEILVSLALPKLPSELSFTEIMAKLSEHFKPQVNKRAERYCAVCTASNATRTHQANIIIK